jgi:hypothetical protein
VDGQRASSPLLAVEGRNLNLPLSQPSPRFACDQRTIEILWFQPTFSFNRVAKATTTTSFSVQSESDNKPENDTLQREEEGLSQESQKKRGVKRKIASTYREVAAECEGRKFQVANTY